jgi:hypothetical protein
LSGEFALPPGHRLAIALSAAALALPLASASRAQEEQQIFISPMGEPFRAPEGKPYPSITWFNGADANHDGVLTLQEFRADAMRFFKVLDNNGDGRISDFEIQRYEYLIAPEIIAATSDTSSQSFQKQDTDEVGTHNTPLSSVKQGAANFSFLGAAEPVKSADADLNNKVTQEEWLAAADRRYRMLLPDGKTDLRFSDLPQTPVQESASKK